MVYSHFLTFVSKLHSKIGAHAMSSQQLIALFKRRSGVQTWSTTSFYVALNFTYKVHLTYHLYIVISTLYISKPSGCVRVALQFILFLSKLHSKAKVAWLGAVT